jgi:hypothetical protein
MNIKSLAIAATAVLAAGSAQAADLNKPAKVAVDYVKVCDAYGAGFFYIPGSDTCLRVSGYVYTGFEIGASNTVARTSPTAATFSGVLVQGQRGANAIDNYTRADERFDARTNTEYGLLRSYIDFHEDLNTSATNSAVTTVRLDRGFVQFGGLTAGRALSFYDFYLGDTFAQNWGDVGPNAPVNLIAYTFAFGNGVSATLSVEDPTTQGYLSTTAGATAHDDRRGGFTFAYGGLNVPDIIGVLNVTQAWGSAQLSGALHQDYGSTAAPSTKFGYGILGGVKLNVPQLGAGDTIGLQAAYGVGNNGHVDWLGSYTFTTPGGVLSDLGADATYSAAAGIKQTRSWSIYGGITHNISPNFEFDFTTGYQHQDNSGTGIGGGNVGGTNNAFHFGQYEFEAQLQWKPIPAVQISPYTEFRTVGFSNGTSANYGLLTRNATTVDFGLRVRRDF